MTKKSKKGNTPEILDRFAQSVVVTEERAKEDQKRQDPSYYQQRVAGPFEQSILERVQGLQEVLTGAIEGITAHNNKVKKDDDKIALPEGVTVESVNAQIEALYTEMYNNAAFGSFNKTRLDGSSMMVIVDAIDGHARCDGRYAMLWNGNPDLRFHEQKNPTGLRSIRVIASGRGLSTWLANDVTNKMRAESDLPALQPREPGTYQRGRRTSRPAASQAQAQEPERAQDEGGSTPVAFGK